MKNFEAATEVSRASTGAVRSLDLASERWDLVSWSGMGVLAKGMRTFNDWNKPAIELVGRSLQLTGQFLGGGFKTGDQLELLGVAWSYLAVATQRYDAPDDYSSWTENTVVQINLDAGGPQYELIPFHATRRIATTCNEGQIKYGPNNWLKGFTCTSLANHFSKHLLKWCNGDRKEDHLGHANWGFMACSHMYMHRQDMTADLLGPNYSITQRLQDILDAHPAHKKPELNTPFITTIPNATYNTAAALTFSKAVESEAAKLKEMQQPKYCNIK